MPGSTTSSPSSTRRSTGWPATPRAIARRAISRRGSRHGTTRTPRGWRCSGAACGGSGVNAAAIGVPRRAGRVVAAFDELLGRPVSMRSLALLRVLAGPAVLLHLQPYLSASLDGRIYSDAFYEPYAAWYPELPEGGLRRAAVAGGGRRGRDVDRPVHAAGHGHRVRDRRLQPLPLDDPLPQQPGLPGDRARGLAVRRGGALYPCARRGSARPRPPGRCGCSASSAARSTSRPRSAS